MEPSTLAAVAATAEKMASRDADSPSIPVQAESPAVPPVALRAARAAAAWAQAATPATTNTPAETAAAAADCSGALPEPNHADAAAAEMNATAVLLQQKQEQLQELEQRQQLLQQKISDCRARVSAIAGQYPSSSSNNSSTMTMYSTQLAAGRNLAPSGTAPWPSTAQASAAVAGSTMPAPVYAEYLRRSSFSGSVRGSAVPSPAAAAATVRPGRYSHDASSMLLGSRTPMPAHSGYTAPMHALTFTGGAASAVHGGCTVGSAGVYPAPHAMPPSSWGAQDACFPAEAGCLSTGLLVQQVQSAAGWRGAEQDYLGGGGSSCYDSCYETVLGCDQSACSGHSFWLDCEPVGNDFLAGYDMY
jgi:hypothetical protein